MGDKSLEQQSMGSNFPNQQPESRGSASRVQSLSSYDDESDSRGGGYGQQNLNVAPGSYPMQSTSSLQQAQQARPDSFNMGPLGGMLPDVSYQTYSNITPQRYQLSPTSSQAMYQGQNIPQFSNAQAISQNMPYHNQYQAQYAGMYAPGQSPSPTNIQPGSHMYQNQGYMGGQQNGAQFFVPQGQYGIQNAMYMGNHVPGQFPMRGAFSGDNRLQAQQRAPEYVGGSGSGGQARSQSIGTNITQPSVVRGPPRKPRQSGHAIWIGNLPPQTDLMSLVLHVCKEASGLESLFLISKSNCAFANFKDEQSCTTAQMKIHDSRFQTVRLVSRLRRNSAGLATGTAVPTGPASLSTSAAANVDRTPSPQVDGDSKDGAENTTENEARGTEDLPLPKDKFFVVKSLTVEDLELSVRNGIWATQSHNEETLNKAYQTSDNVYLIFSANKSGEYFGYAKMISPINDDPAAAIEFAPKAHTVEDPELPKAIPTPATEFAPKGRIIDDSARGTIFWEVERDEEDERDDGDDDSGSNRSGHDPETASSSKAWGKPFQVEWISTTRLPFYRTRGLRNPWNSNREVKIARDGTELETAIGRRLVGLFHRLPSPAAPSNAQGMSFPMIGGFPQSRPFQ